MDDFPFVSIVIPVRNVAKIIEPCLKSLASLNYPKDKYEVIISDSHSTDNTKEIVEKYNDIYISTEKQSICAGRNEGFKVAKGDIIAFSDADCVMDKDWIKNSIKYFKDKKIGGVGGINITPENETDFGKAVGFVLDQPIFSAGSTYARILKKTKEVKAIAGCNAIYKREVLEKVMPMDETLIEAEDYVMNQKIRDLGYKLLYTPDTILWHYRRPKPKNFFKQIYRYAIGRVLIGRKDYKMINMVHILAGFGIPIFLVLSLFLITLKPLCFFYFLLAVFFFFFFYFMVSLAKTKSLKVSLLVPYVIIILFLGWSFGFLRQIFFPTKKH